MYALKMALAFSFINILYKVDPLKNNIFAKINVTEIQHIFFKSM